MMIFWKIPDIYFEIPTPRPISTGIPWSIHPNSTRQSDVMGKMSPPTSLLGGGAYTNMCLHTTICWCALLLLDIETLWSQFWDEYLRKSYDSLVYLVSLKRPCLSKMSPRKIVNGWCLTRVETCLFHSHIFFFIFTVQQNASRILSILPGF